MHRHINFPLDTDFIEITKITNVITGNYCYHPVRLFNEITIFNDLRSTWAAARLFDHVKRDVIDIFYVTGQFMRWRGY